MLDPRLRVATEAGCKRICPSDVPATGDPPRRAHHAGKGPSAMGATRYLKRSLACSAAFPFAGQTGFHPQIRPTHALHVTARIHGLPLEGVPFTGNPDWAIMLAGQLGDAPPRKRAWLVYPACCSDSSSRPSIGWSQTGGSPSAGANHLRGHVGCFIASCYQMSSSRPKARRTVSRRLRAPPGSSSKPPSTALVLALAPPSLPLHDEICLRPTNVVSCKGACHAGVGYASNSLQVAYSLVSRAEDAIMAPSKPLSSEVSYLLSWLHKVASRRGSR